MSDKTIWINEQQPAVNRGAVLVDRQYPETLMSACSQPCCNRLIVNVGLAYVSHT